MKWLLAPMIGAATLHPPYLLEDPAPQEQQDSADDVEDCQKNVQELRNGVLGLELFLKDKSDHSLYCPRLEWEQPALEIYKEDPKSHLPEECTKDKI